MGDFGTAPADAANTTFTDASNGDATGEAGGDATVEATSGPAEALDGSPSDGPADVASSFEATPDTTACTNACSPGQAQCANGGLSTCTLSATTGCYVYAPATACPAHQSCSGAAGSAACTCSLDPVCSSISSACEGTSTLVSCGQDVNGCFYQTASMGCANVSTCASGECACCAGTCVDEETDSNNCGGCGLTCSTGCVAGRCLVTLASGTIGTLMALDSNGGLFFVQTPVHPTTQFEDPGVYRVPVVGGTVSTVMAGRQVDTRGMGVTGLAVGTDSVYYADDENNAPINVLGLVFQAPLADSGAPNQLFRTTVITGLVLTTSGVYVQAAGGIYALPSTEGDGGLGSPLRNTDLCTSSMLTTDSVDIYCIGAGFILHFGLGSGSVASFMIATAQDNASAIAVANGTVYWSNMGTSANNFADGSILAASVTAPVAGLTVQTLASGQTIGSGGAIVADSTNVYWTSGLNPGTVMKVGIAGGTVTTLATGQAAPAGIAVDSTSVYWATQGTIMKLTPK